MVNPYKTVLMMVLMITAVCFSCKSWATADGPDYFQTVTDNVPLHEKADLLSLVITHLDSGKIYLKNMGCTGIPTYSEWSSMSEEERLDAKDKAWCHVSYNEQTGWVQQKYLTEGSPPAYPTFECSETSHEIETVICKDSELIKLDHLMHDVYARAQEAASNLDAGKEEAVKYLKATQHGWIRGRNDCWKALEQKRQCAVESYEERIAFLQTKWMLTAPIREPVRYTCDEDPANEIHVAFYRTLTKPAVAIEHGDSREIFIQNHTASGSRYEGSHAKYFWLRGNEARFVWDQFKPEQICKTM